MICPPTHKHALTLTCAKSHKCRCEPCRAHHAERRKAWNPRTDRVSGELARIEDLATAAHDYGGDEQELGELALELVAEVRAAREREAAGYDVYQPAYQMADGSFGFGYDMEYPTRELAEYHVHRDSPWDFVVRQRRGPWEPVTEGDDDDQ